MQFIFYLKMHFYLLFAIYLIYLFLSNEDYFEFSSKIRILSMENILLAVSIY